MGNNLRTTSRVTSRILLKYDLLWSLIANESLINAAIVVVIGMMILHREKHGVGMDDIFKMA